jgi:hypothetical protein
MRGAKGDNHHAKFYSCEVGWPQPPTFVELLGDLEAIEAAQATLEGKVIEGSVRLVMPRWGEPL